MKKRHIMRNRRGAVRRGVGFSFAILIGMSTLLGFATQIITPQTAHAYSANEDKKRRYLSYFQDCLTNYLDVDGRANDNNGDNLQFETLDGDNLKEMFKPGQVIAVGHDMEGGDNGNGVMACATIARKAIFYVTGMTSKDGEAWLQKKVWGRSLSNGKPIKVGTGRNDEISPLKVRVNAVALVNQVEPLRKEAAAGYTKKTTLNRLEPLFMQCFKDLATTNKAGTFEDGSLVYADIKFFAARKRFDWDEQKLVKINGNSGINSSKKAEIGSIEVNFAPGASKNPLDRGSLDFNDRTSNWYPLGNDLSNTELGSGSRFEGQTILDCNFFKSQFNYFFTGGSKKTSVHWVIRNNKLAFAEDKDGDGKIDDDEISETQSVTPGASEGTDSGSEDASGSNDACGDGSGGGALRWILCPVVNAINEGIQWATDEIIGPALAVSPLEDGGTLYEAWKAIRNLANVFLIVIFLIIIFANFFASENSSYTVKRALPRLVAAAIFIQFSFFFCAVLVDIGNVLGNGIGIIIVQATGGVAGGAGATAGAELASGLLVGGAIAGGAVVATILGAWILLLPLAIGLVISILTLILSLGVRLIALNLLIMLAPLALLAWTLPNTDKYFKMWGTNLIKLIMMYPMIIAMMAAAQVVVTVGAGNDSSTFGSVLTLFAPMIAFFMIPATFKMSGTVISGINGAIASKGKSFSNATAGTLRKNMGESIKKNSALKFGDPKSGKLTKTVSRLGMGVGTGFGIGAQSKMKRASAVGAAFKEKKDLLHHDYEERGISGDNAAMMKEIFDKDANGGKGGFRPNVDSATRAAVMQMISENGGVEEMSAMYESLRANNGGESYSQKWNHADRDLWNRGSATTRDRLAKSLPYAVRPDSDRSLGKMDAEGITGLKASAGKLLTDEAGNEIAGSSHIEQGLAEIAERASGGIDPNTGKAYTAEQQEDAKKQQQKVLASMVGVGQSTDRRGRIDAENVKAFERAAKAGLLGDATMMIPGTSTPISAADFARDYIEPGTGQLKVVPEH